MKLESFKIKNFRCFQEISLNFHEQMTVIVGKNGAGKTSVLDALANFLRFYLPRSSYKPVELTTSDICFSNQGPIEFRILFSSVKEKIYTFPPNDKKPDMLPVRVYIPDLDEIREAITREEQQKELPFIAAYYSAQRCLTIANNKYVRIDDDSDEIFSAGFSPKINFATSLEWFDSKDAEEARKRSKNKDLDYTDPELSAVRDAIIKAFPGEQYEFPHMDGTPPELYVTDAVNDYELKITQLSEGYKTMLALVMDLARRMAAAKTIYFPDSPGQTLECPGIILIDEVELHLHPAWQQTVLPSLMEIFPNIQFIVSTHSPQVVTSVKPENLMILQDGFVADVEISTYGAETSPVLEDVFGMSARPHNEATIALGKYLDLIDEGNGTSKEALALREKLEALMPGDPILATADRMILREERRRERMVKSHA